MIPQPGSLGYCRKFPRRHVHAAYGDLASLDDGGAWKGVTAKIEAWVARLPAGGFLGLWSAGGVRERRNREQFEIQVTSHSVKVSLNASKKSPRGRFYWCFFFLAVWIAVLSLAVFAKGKHGQPSMWHDLATHPVNSQGFIIPLAILLGVSALTVLMSWRYIVMAHPSDQIFYCDGSTLTIAKVRWLDIHNTDWRTRSYPLNAITGMSYRAVARTRGSAVYGIRFRAAGRPERVLPGLGTQDAAKILHAMKALGADVEV